MRSSYFKILAAGTVIIFSVSQMALAAPLVPGKPAGVKAAQMGDKEWLVFGGLTVLVAAVLIANNGSGHQTTVAPPFTATST